MRKVLLPVGVILVGILIFVALVKLKPQPARVAPPPSRPVVAVYHVDPEPSPVRIRGFGSVQAKRSVDVTPQVSGELLEKPREFEAGNYISKGQVLLRIDDTDYALAAAKAEADVAQAEYNLALAEEEAQVAKREWDRIGDSGLMYSVNDSLQATALVMYEPQLKLARARLDAARAALRQAEVSLERCTIRAPFDGRVLHSNVDVGQYLRAGTAVGTVYATDIAEVTVSVADGDLAWISTRGDTDDQPGVPVEVSADFAGDRHSWAGRAVRLGGAVDSRSRLVPVVVEIRDPYEIVENRPPLVEGMFVEVTFSAPPGDGAVTIPRTALRPGNEVWVVDTDSRIRIRTVSLARAGVEEAVVQEGIEPGEMVCISNLQYVTEGMQVRIEGQPRPAAATPAGGEDLATAEQGGER